MRPFVSVVVPAHNEEKYIADCLRALAAQDYGSNNFEVIVVDNDSSDSTPEIIKSFPGVQYYFKKDGPVGAVRNFGVRKAKGDYIAFLDGDCVTPNDWISHGSKLLQDQNFSAFGGKYEVDEKGTWIERYWLLGNKHESSHTLDLIGGTIFITRKHFDLIKGFDETITSGEDTKLAEDLRRSGLAVKIHQSLNVIHLGNAKTVRDFIARQAWHSENYLTAIRQSLKDPTFLLIVAFILCLTVAIISPTFGEATVSIQALVTAAIIPNIFSIKRILRSKTPKYNLRHYHKIYALDLFYTLGRVIGITRNLKLLLKNDK